MDLRLVRPHRYGDLRPVAIPGTRKPATKRPKSARTASPEAGIATACSRLCQVTCTAGRRNNATAAEWTWQSLDMHLRHRPVLVRAHRQPAIQRKFLPAGDGAGQKQRDRAVGVLRPSAGALHVLLEQRHPLELPVRGPHDAILEHIAGGRGQFRVERQFHVMAVEAQGQRLIGDRARFMGPRRQTPIVVGRCEAVGRLRPGIRRAPKLSGSRIPTVLPARAV